MTQQPKDRSLRGLVALLREWWRLRKLVRSIRRWDARLDKAERKAMRKDGWK